MPKKLLFVIFFFFLFGGITQPVWAITPTSTPPPLLSSPTVTPTLPDAVTTAQTTCDMCGWCNRDTNPPAPSPQNWLECKNCLYEDYDEMRLKPNSYYTVFGCWSTNAGDFVGKILGMVFGVAGGIAFLAFVAGVAIILTSSGDPQRIQTGKDILSSSLFGLLLIIFSTFLLRTVGLDILKIPGFG